MASVTVNGLNGLYAGDALDVYWYLVADDEDWSDIGAPIQSGSTFWALSEGVLTFTINFSQVDGSYNLLIYTNVDGGATRNTGDAYLEYFFTISGAVITFDPVITDWNIYLYMGEEYVGWTSEKLWQYIPETVRQRDRETSQIKVNGTGRGQFERYLMSVSRAMSQIIGNSINAKKIHGFANSVSSFLYKILESRGFPYNPAWVEGRRRIVFEDTVMSNKLAGNIRALNALAYRFFGWEITGKSFSIDAVFILNTRESIIYTEGLPEDSRSEGNLGDDTASSSGNYTGNLNTTYNIKVTTGGLFDGNVAEVTITSTGAEIISTTYKPVDDAFFDLGTLGAKMKLLDGGDGDLIIDDEWTLEARVQKLFYDEDIHGDLSEAVYIVDYHSDPDFVTKRPDFEAFISKFLVSGFTFSFQYI